METSQNAIQGRLHNVTGKPTFETIVNSHGSTVLRVRRAVVGPVDADDAWSETFLAAMRAYPDLPADANVEAWLVTIAHRKAIDAARKMARSPVPMAAPPHDVAIVDRDQPGAGRGSDRCLATTTTEAATSSRLPLSRRSAVRGRRLHHRRQRRGCASCRRRRHRQPATHVRGRSNNSRSTR